MIKEKNAFIYLIMNTKLFFLVSSLALIVLTVVTICTAPNINRIVEQILVKIVKNILMIMIIKKNNIKIQMIINNRNLIILNKMLIYVKEEKQFMI